MVIEIKHRFARNFALFDNALLEKGFHKQSKFPSFCLLEISLKTLPKGSPTEYSVA